MTFAAAARIRGFNPWNATDIAIQVALERDLDTHAEHRGLVASKLILPSPQRPAVRILVTVMPGWTCRDVTTPCGQR